MAEERRSSLSYDMGGSLETGQTSQKRNQRDSADIQDQLDKLDRECNAAKKLLETQEEELLEVRRQNGEIMRRNEEHEALSRMLLFILSDVSGVYIMRIILQEAQRMSVDPDLALVALERLYGEVSTKAIPRLIKDFR